VVETELDSSIIFTIRLFIVVKSQVLISCNCVLSSNNGVLMYVKGPKISSNESLKNSTFICFQLTVLHLHLSIP